MSHSEGHEGKLYVSEDGIGAPSWVEVLLARNVKLTPSHTELDVSTRGGGGWKQTALGLTDVTIDVELLYDPEDEPTILIEAAFVTKAVIGLADTSKGILVSGSRVFQADCVVSKFDRS